jgi:diguanylate cyclase (GGDEF)-like protein/PAS domain S-box-containing protein
MTHRARFFLLLLALLPTLAMAEETLRLGIFPARPKEVMEEKYRMLEIYLSGALPGQRVVIEILDMNEMEAALDAKRLDFVFTNPSHFVILRHRNRLSGAIATVQTNEDGRGANVLGGVILVSAKRSDIKSLADLRAKRIAIPGMRFLGGYQAQAYELLQAGIDLPGDAKLIEVGGHDKVIEALLAGQADAGFVRTGIVEALTREGKLPAGELKLVNPQSFPEFPYAISTRLYPEWAFAALPHVPAATVKRIARALLFIEPDMPVAEAAGIAGFGIPGDYQTVEELARALRLPPYERVEFRATDVWQRYRWIIMAGLGALGLIVLLSAGLLLGNHRLRREQGKLATSERRLNLIVEAANLGTWDWHLPSGKVDFSTRLTDMLGYAPGELAPHVSSWEQLIHPADQARVRATLDAHLNGQTPRYTCAHRLQHQDGHWVWVLDAGQITERDADGAVLYLRGIHMDITETKEAEAALAQREQHLHTLLASMNDVVMVFDTAGNIAECHWPLGDAEAPDTSRWCGTECSAVLPPTLTDTLGEIMGELILDPDTPHHREFAWSLADRTRWFSATFSALKNSDDPYPRGFLCVARDITQRKDEEAALAKTRAEIEKLSRRNQLLLDAAGEGIYGVDQEGNIDFINPSALAMLGLTEAEALGRNAHELFHDRRLDGTPYPQAECPLHLTLLDGLRRETEEVFLRRNGELFFVHVVATSVIDNGQQLGAEVVFLDISARKAMEAELTRVATTDMLTGVPNRRHFMSLAETELARIQRFQQPTAVLMLDLDYFKQINDTHGHAAGDAVLKTFADIVRGSLRKTDCSGRLGGEEFAVLLPGTDSEAAFAFAERLRQATAACRIPFGTQELLITVSIGIAMMVAADGTPDEALARADQALYRAKDAGRNRVSL